MNSSIGGMRAPSADFPVAGRMVGDTFIYPLRVFYEDTDAAGIVYYANYLKFIERARTEMLRAGGIDHSGMQAEHGVLFVVRRCTLDYRLPARLDDMLEIHTRIIAVKGASLAAEQDVLREFETLVHIELRLACITGDGAPARFPAALRAALETLRRGQERTGTGA